MNNKQLLVLILLVLSLPSHAEWTAETEKTLIDASSQTIRDFRETDPSLKRFFFRAVGWVVFPSVSQAGVIVGGAHGSGVVYQRGRIIGFSKLKQLTVGLQFGGRTFSEIVFFENKPAFAQLKQERLELDASKHGVAMREGKAKDTDYHDGIAIFTLARDGQVSGPSVGNQHLSFEPR